MAESVIFAAVEPIIGKLSSLIVEELSLAWGVKTDFESLKDTLRTVNAVVSDAEKQQQHNDQVGVWLAKLKDVLYDAEDVLDEFQYYILRREVLMRGSITRKFLNFFSRSNPVVFRFKMGRQIKGVKERLDKIANDRVKFHLTEQHMDEPLVQREREAASHSSLPASDVIGRDDDKENVIQILMDCGGEDLFVVPIVGIGGLGKTTLAKLVYNDRRVSMKFELKLWVFVGKDFDVKKLTKKIIESATSGVCEDLSMDLLQTRLKRNLEGRKFLLILDDVWNDNRERWIELKNLLTWGAKGSSVIVTTRIHDVAPIIGPIHANYELEGLPYEECLSLFVKWAFKEGCESQYPNLVKIGKKIVKKCKGVPLAVRTLGASLYMKNEEHEWQKVLNNEIWKLEQTNMGILPALKLSYDILPSHLKRCFSYCSIFAKNHLLLRDELIRLWMAQGLILPTNINEELEDTGKRYFNFLCSRSFFQDVDELVEQNDVEFTMHDLIHDLALSVTYNDIFTCNPNETSLTIPENIRHLSFNKTFSETSELSLTRLTKLRTFWFLPRESYFINHIPISTLNIKYVRVLDLSGSTFEVLPDSIGNLKHLKHLSILFNKNLRRLPNSICKLHNLQTLMFTGCSNLGKLPKDIGNLINLRCFTLSTKEKSFPEKGIGCLTSLRVLGFFECEYLEYFPQDMQNLTSLRELFIFDCPTITSFPDGMHRFVVLKHLSIQNCENLIARYLPETGEDWSKIAHIPSIYFDTRKID